MSSEGVLDVMGADNAAAVTCEFWLGILAVPTTGNKGWDTGVGLDERGPGGVVWNEGWSVADGRGGVTFCMGNKGLCASPKGAAGGTGTAGCCGNQGCGRGTGQPGGTATAEL